MLAHPSGSASPNLPSEAKLLRRISRHFPQIRKHSTQYTHTARYGKAIRQQVLYGNDRAPNAALRFLG
jgi:hypothetical protein